MRGLYRVHFVTDALVLLLFRGVLTCGSFVVGKGGRMKASKADGESERAVPEGCDTLLILGVCNPFNFLT